jgi:hypothetical protein
MATDTREQRAACSFGDVSDIVGVGEERRGSGLAIFETLGQTVHIDLQLRAATEAGAALLSERFDLVADGEERSAGVAVEAVELGTRDAVTGWRLRDVLRHVGPTFTVMVDNQREWWDANVRIGEGHISSSQHDGRLYRETLGGNANVREIRR